MIFVKIKLSFLKFLCLNAFLMYNSFFLQAQKYELPSILLVNQRLVYNPDSLGNNIPDYSYCGYQLSEKSIPQVPVKVVVPPTKTDATAVIQNAIDYVANLPIQSDGFRGAVLLKEGNYSISGRLKIHASGIVLRGSGEKTIIKAAGVNRETLLSIIGKNDIEIKKTANISTNYIPVNATVFEVEEGNGLFVGESVFIRRLSNKTWIQELEMEDYGGETGWLGWKPGERDVIWERKIKNINGNKIEIDAPLTEAINSNYGGGEISSFSWQGRISNVGVENLTLESDFNSDNIKDEDHCWFAVTMENVQDAWVRQVNFHRFAGSAVALYETSSQISVEDCISLDPVSEIAGQRRNTFFTMGQQTLFLRCYAENGNHDFATGFCAAGPNAFVQCESVAAHNFSGAVDSWASGVLFDIVNVEGQALSYKNRGQDGQGAGWTAVNSMFWQCTAGRIECFSPPTAQNFAYGAWAQFAGNGIWFQENSHINPRSLFFAQLAQRKGESFNIYDTQLLPYSGESTSSPSIEQAKEYSSQSNVPPVQLTDFIRNANVRNPISLDEGDAVNAEKIPVRMDSPGANISPVEIKNGWLIQESKVLSGYKQSVPWWRGDPRPFEALKASPAITRFVPGRVGNGYTDDLEKVVEAMTNNNVVSIDHNYGLWYDRRRDDHERVKRFDSESWAPFYEQPFTRSGKGEAWDRLSKYDLTKYNSFYWDRLSEFARLAEIRGKVLIHQNYFQHNILEAGAHWTDSPWRPANNINNTGFPEPPPYSGDKRIYMADQFYDIDHPVRRELHRAYIRQCLNNFVGQSNVIQSISAEYTGPLHFVEFWLDVISEWEIETGNEVKVALSTTKDVQDAILADAKRSKLIDIIDIQYWAYRDDGSLYAPAGGVNLAPRQHARQVKTGKRSFEQVYRAVSEYRAKYPGKAVTYSEGNNSGFGWAVFMAGGSLAALNNSIPDVISIAASSMLPVGKSKAQQNTWALENKREGLIIYSKSNEKIDVDLKDYKGEYIARFLNPETGGWLDKPEILKGNKCVKFDNPIAGDIVIWINKK